MQGTLRPRGEKTQKTPGLSTRGFSAKKLYMQDGISATVKSITTADEQTLYLSKHDVDLIQGKKVAIVDDVISTGGSLIGLEKLIEQTDAKIVCKAFVLAEGDAKDRKDIVYLGTIPLL